MGGLTGAGDLPQLALERGRYLVWWTLPPPGRDVARGVVLTLNLRCLLHINHVEPCCDICGPSCRGSLPHCLTPRKGRFGFNE